MLNFTVKIIYHVFKLNVRTASNNAVFKYKRKLALFKTKSRFQLYYKGPFPLRAWKKAFFVCFIDFFLRSLQF